MTKLAAYILSVLSLSLLVCGCNSSSKHDNVPKEDKRAKSMLEGIWADADVGNVVFMVKGDTVYYPDSTLQPVEFRIIQDTMFLLGNNMSKYPIIRQSENLFEFKNQNNDIVKLSRSEDSNDSLFFFRRPTVILNQGKIIKRDTIVRYEDKQYHCYVQVNPTTYKVFRSYYNSEGMEIENVYYDNIIHVSNFAGRNKIFSKDFRKNDFVNSVPKNMLKQCILSDIKLVGVDERGFKYQTQLAIPDSPSSFIVDLYISYAGKINMAVAQ